MVETNGRRVLVVDDEEDILEVTAFTLELEGYQVATARNGLEALEAVTRDMPHLILLDMKMPIMNGWEFAHEFRSRYDRQVPIVVITAASDARERAHEIGARDWIPKPFDLDFLVSVVGRHARTR